MLRRPIFDGGQLRDVKVFCKMHDANGERLSSRSIWRLTLQEWTSLHGAFLCAGLQAPKSEDRCAPKRSSEVDLHCEVTLIPKRKWSSKKHANLRKNTSRTVARSTHILAYLKQRHLTQILFCGQIQHRSFKPLKSGFRSNRSDPNRSENSIRPQILTLRAETHTCTRATLDSTTLIALKLCN